MESVAMNRTGWLWICALLLLLGGPLQAWQEPVAPATEEEPQEEAGESAPQTVDERIEELDQKIRVLERRDELEKEQAAEKAKTATNVTSGRDGFSFRSTDGAYQRTPRRDLPPHR